MKKYQCPCCKYYTYNVPANEDCGYICPVCFWENDPFIASDSEPSDSNHGITLKEAKENYLKFGACEKEMLCHVRPPKDNEKEPLYQQFPVCLRHRSAGKCINGFRKVRESLIGSYSRKKIRCSTDEALHRISFHHPKKSQIIPIVSKLVPSFVL